ncbi:DUF5712 family protein [Spirosoma endophyticum]|uniref:Relaxase/Mobilisation nuclease domain-containing protein n=1 Tax=Spirosoma endophyticum TaxID=662367 RepID=A0A1I2F992_9BACT|nr:DUF5712 family protein [Spirosoma endophyticum]SFF02024.1 hypothetical protein SAMN05216167_12513 [Spirosoma endophyticum]
MQTKFASPVEATNKGSSARLVNYLEKENVSSLSTENEYFFSVDRDKCNKWEVIQQIDNNAKSQKIEKNQDRFFSIIIAPSQAELAQIGNDSGKLKEFTRSAMENYASGFCNYQGESRGVESKDLVWYAKIEHERKYTSLDAEVKEGLAEKGQLKEGDQRHIHIIVSRCEGRENRYILESELKRQKQEQTAHLCPNVNNPIIFSRDAFYRATEQTFDKLFTYERKLEESYDYCNAIKNGKQQDYEKVIQRENERVPSKSRNVEKVQDFEIGY